MAADQDTDIQHAITRLDQLIVELERRQEEFEQKMDEFYGGHGPSYDPEMDLRRSHNAFQTLTLFEKHRTHPLLPRWLADHLREATDMIPYLILQTLDHILYDTPPLVTSDDIAKDS